MPPPLLIVDVSALAYRALHTTGDLSHEGVATGVTFGVFREVMGLMEDFGTSRVAWCFDGGCGKRRELSPTYKAARRDRELTEEEAEARRACREQIDAMQKDYLPAAGFRNLFRRSGYEADDVIASVSLSLPETDRAVIVSGDHDLFQLLRCNVSQWLPVRKRMVTAASFEAEWGVPPGAWPKVLAIAGCDGDGVEGIRGVGEKTAVKWLRGTLKPGSVKWEAIRAGMSRAKENDRLVRLPFPGVGRFELAEGERIDWGPVLRRLGMGTLDGKFGKTRQENET